VRVYTLIIRAVSSYSFVVELMSKLREIRLPILFFGWRHHFHKRACRQKFHLFVLAGKRAQRRTEQIAERAHLNILRNFGASHFSFSKFFDIFPGTILLRYFGYSYRFRRCSLEELRSKSRLFEIAFALLPSYIHSLSLQLHNHVG
jgi:hypothetical protein